MIRQGNWNVQVHICATDEGGGYEGYLRRNGTQPMAGNLDMGGWTIGNASGIASKVSAQSLEPAAGFTALRTPGKSDVKASFCMHAPQTLEPIAAAFSHGNVVLHNGALSIGSRA